MDVVEIPVVQVVIPADRIREEFDPVALEELKVSMDTIGLLHPIIIEQGDILIAGHRRLLAAKLLGWPTIHAAYRNDLDPLTRKIVEYDENRRRSALTWQEDAKAITEIHDMKLQQDAAWTLQKTADELGISVAKVHEDIRLASSIQVDTTILDQTAINRIVNRPTRQGALVTMKRERESALVRELARRQQAAAPEDVHRVIHHGDAHDTMAGIESDSIDLVVTDPPWLIDVGQTSQVAKLKSAGYEDINDAEILLAISDLYRLLKPGRHFYCFVSADDLVEWIARIQSVGFEVRRRPLVWVKEGWHGISDPYRRFMNGYDAILWSYKPDDQGSFRNFVNPVNEIASHQPTVSWHSASKPINLLKTWIETSSMDGEIVLDPFAGSGTTLIAAKQSNRRYVGIEKDKITYDNMVRDVDGSS